MRKLVLTALLLVLVGAVTAAWLSSSTPSGSAIGDITLAENRIPGTGLRGLGVPPRPDPTTPARSPYTAGGSGAASPESVTPGSGHARSRRRSRKGPTPRLPPLAAGRSPAVVTVIRSAHAFAATTGARRAEPASRGAGSAGRRWGGRRWRRRHGRSHGTQPRRRRARSRRRSQGRQQRPRLPGGDRQGHRAAAAALRRRQRRLAAPAAPAAIRAAHRSGGPGVRRHRLTRRRSSASCHRSAPASRHRHHQRRNQRRCSCSARASRASIACAATWSNKGARVRGCCDGARMQRHAAPRRRRRNRSLCTGARGTRPPVVGRARELARTPARPRRRGRRPSAPRAVGRAAAGAARRRAGRGRGRPADLRGRHDHRRRIHPAGVAAAGHRRRHAAARRHRPTCARWRRRSDSCCWPSRCRL